MQTRKTSSRIIILILLAILVLILLTIPAPARAQSFQNLLDRSGIPYMVPPSGKAILVNIPAYEMILFQDGAPVMRSRVIVGAPWHRTPRLNTYVSAVRFRPTWRPTASMVASGEYRDYVRRAGESNPLGLAAVRLQPGLLVYLHDTNRRELFAKDKRALSHGCVRVEKWAELVAFVLDMNIAEVMKLAQGNRTFDAPAPPIPVELGYYTRFPDSAGVIVTHPDIYGLQPTSERQKGDPQAQALACILDPS